VTADPVPDKAVFLHNCQSPVLETDANGIDGILAFQLLELQTGVCWITLEKTKGSFGLSERQRVDRKMNARTVS
jgi:hypothetical protein